MNVKAWKDGEEVNCFPTAGDEFNPHGWSKTPDVFTIYTSWEIDEHSAHRIAGEYRLGTASAELYYDTGVVSQHPWKQGRMKMRTVQIEDARELYTLVRSGKILPVNSYENEQQATVIRQFGDLWREFKLLLRLTINNTIAKFGRT